MSMLRSFGFGSTAELEGLLDSGPDTQSSQAVPTAGGGFTLEAGPLVCLQGEDFAQSCPVSPDLSWSLAESDVFPCPCDRWCKISGPCHDQQVVDLPSPIHNNFGMGIKVVNFADQVEVFEYFDGDFISQFQHRWMPVTPDVDVGYGCNYENGASPQNRGCFVVQPGLRGFWDFWQACWELHCSTVDFNGPTLPSGGQHGRFGLAPASSPVSLPGIQWRNENDPVPALRANPVNHAVDFEFTLDDEQDSDNDLGVSFYRWQDVADLVDVFPLSSAAAIPFITFGLRNVPLGRRDFVSPDLSPSRLRELIWNLWQDEAHQFDDLVIHFVRPQPIRELDCPGVIILIIEICYDDMPQAVSPVLELACDRHDRPIDVPQAIYVPTPVNDQGLLPYFRSSHLCAPTGFRQCQLSIAGSAVGTAVLPVVPGAVIKLVVSAKLRLFAQAAPWFPDIERFATQVRNVVREGTMLHSVQVHRAGAPVTSLNFRIADLFRPPAFMREVERVCGHEVRCVFPLIGSVLNAANPAMATPFHLLVFPHESECPATFMVVTQVFSPYGSILRCSNRACVRDEVSDLHELHNDICLELGLGSGWQYSFLCDDCTVYDVRTIAHTSVVTHAIHQAHHDDPVDSVANQMDLSEDNGELNLADVDPSDPEDDVSLLQTQVHRKIVNIFQHAHPVSTVVVTPDTEDIERCDVAMQVPHRFGSLQGWLARRHYDLLSRCDQVEILVDPWRPDKSVDILMEACVIQEDHMEQQLLAILRLPVLCSWENLLKELGAQFGLPASLIESVSLDGSTWFFDECPALYDGAHCQIVISDPMDTMQGGAPLTDQAHPVEKRITTYVCGLSHVHCRYDIVGPHHPDDVLDALTQACSPQQPLQCFKVGWDPSHLEPCRQLVIIDTMPSHQCLSALVCLGGGEGSQTW